MGTIQGFHYSKEVWKVMTKEQGVKVVEHRKAKSDVQAVKAANTTQAGPVLMDIVLDKLENLTHAIKSLDSNRETDQLSADHHNSSRQKRGWLLVWEFKLFPWLQSVWSAQGAL